MLLPRVISDWLAGEDAIVCVDQQRARRGKVVDEAPANKHHWRNKFRETPRLR